MGAHPLVFWQVVEGVSDERLRIFLYHIPQMTGVPITASLIERLRAAHPTVFVGIKDSSDDMPHTSALLERFAPSGFRVFGGSERHLVAVVRQGGAGCISATANINPAAIARAHERARTADADVLQRELIAVRDVIQGTGAMVAAMKAVLARFLGQETWRDVRPPLVPLTEERALAVFRALDKVGFAMKGL